MAAKDKNMLSSDGSTQKHIDLKNITPEIFQKLNLSEREQVHEVIENRSLRVRVFSQHFLDQIGV